MGLEQSSAQPAKQLLKSSDFNFIANQILDDSQILVSKGGNSFSTFSSTTTPSKELQRAYIWDKDSKLLLDYLNLIPSHEEIARPVLLQQFITAFAVMVQKHDIDTVMYHPSYCIPRVNSCTTNDAQKWAFLLQFFEVSLKLQLWDLLAELRLKYPRFYLPYPLLTSNLDPSNLSTPTDTPQSVSISTYVSTPSKISKQTPNAGVVIENTTRTSKTSSPINVYSVEGFFRDYPEKESSILRQFCNSPLLNSTNATKNHIALPYLLQTYLYYTFAEISTQQQTLLNGMTPSTNNFTYPSFINHFVFPLQNTALDPNVTKYHHHLENIHQTLEFHPVTHCLYTSRIPDSPNPNITNHPLFSFFFQHYYDLTAPAPILLRESPSDAQSVQPYEILTWDTWKSMVNLLVAAQCQLLSLHDEDILKHLPLSYPNLLSHTIAMGKSTPHGSNSFGINSTPNLVSSTSISSRTSSNSSHSQQSATTSQPSAQLTSSAHETQSTMTNASNDAKSGENPSQEVPVAITTGPRLEPVCTSTSTSSRSKLSPLSLAPPILNLTHHEHREHPFYLQIYNNVREHMSLIEAVTPSTPFQELLLFNLHLKSFLLSGGHGKSVFHRTLGQNGIISQAKWAFSLHQDVKPDVVSKKSGFVNSLSSSGNASSAHITSAIKINPVQLTLPAQFANMNFKIDEVKIFFYRALCVKTCGYFTHNLANEVTVMNSSTPGPTVKFFMGIFSSLNPTLASTRPAKLQINPPKPPNWSTMITPLTFYNKVFPNYTTPLPIILLLRILLSGQLTPNTSILPQAQDYMNTLWAFVFLVLHASFRLHPNNPLYSIVAPLNTPHDYSYTQHNNSPSSTPTRTSPKSTPLSSPLQTPSQPPFFPSSLLLNCDDLASPNAKPVYNDDYAIRNQLDPYDFPLTPIPPTLFPLMSELAHYNCLSTLLNIIDSALLTEQIPGHLVKLYSQSQSLRTSNASISPFLPHAMNNIQYFTSSLQLIFSLGLAPGYTELPSQCVSSLATLHDDSSPPYQPNDSLTAIPHHTLGRSLFIKEPGLFEREELRTQLYLSYLPLLNPYRYSTCANPFYHPSNILAFHPQPHLELDPLSFHLMKNTTSLRYSLQSQFSPSTITPDHHKSVFDVGVLYKQQLNKAIQKFQKVYTFDEIISTEFNALHIFILQSSIKSIKKAQSSFVTQVLPPTGHDQQLSQLPSSSSQHAQTVTLTLPTPSGKYFQITTPYLSFPLAGQLHTNLSRYKLSTIYRQHARLWSLLFTTGSFWGIIHQITGNTCLSKVAKIYQDESASPLYSTISRISELSNMYCLQHYALTGMILPYTALLDEKSPYLPHFTSLLGSDSTTSFFRSSSASDYTDLLNLIDTVCSVDIKKCELVYSPIPLISSQSTLPEDISKPSPQHLSNSQNTSKAQPPTGDKHINSQALLPSTPLTLDTNYPPAINLIPYTPATSYPQLIAQMITFYAATYPPLLPTTFAPSLVAALFRFANMALTRMVLLVHTMFLQSLPVPISCQTPPPPGSSNRPINPIESFNLQKADFISPILVTEKDSPASNIPQPPLNAAIHSCFPHLGSAYKREPLPLNRLEYYALYLCYGHVLFSDSMLTQNYALHGIPLDEYKTSSSSSSSLSLNNDAGTSEDAGWDQNVSMKETGTEANPSLPGFELTAVDDIDSAIQQNACKSSDKATNSTKPRHQYTYDHILAFLDEDLQKTIRSDVNVIFLEHIIYQQAAILAQEHAYEFNRLSAQLTSPAPTTHSNADTDDSFGKTQSLKMHSLQYSPALVNHFTKSVTLSFDQFLIQTYRQSTLSQYSLKNLIEFHEFNPFHTVEECIFNIDASISTFDHDYMDNILNTAQCNPSNYPATAEAKKAQAHLPVVQRKRPFNTSLPYFYLKSCPNPNIDDLTSLLQGLSTQTVVISTDDDDVVAASTPARSHHNLHHSKQPDHAQSPLQEHHLCYTTDLTREWQHVAYFNGHIPQYQTLFPSTVAIELLILAIIRQLDETILFFLYNMVKLSQPNDDTHPLSNYFIQITRALPKKAPSGSKVAGPPNPPVSAVVPVAPASVLNHPSMTHNPAPTHPPHAATSNHLIQLTATFTMIMNIADLIDATGIILYAPGFVELLRNEVYPTIPPTPQQWHPEIIRRSDSTFDPNPDTLSRLTHDEARPTCDANGAPVSTRAFFPFD